MKRSGFTLVELMGVIVIIALISVIISPVIMNQISSKKDKLSSVFENIVLNATKEYIASHPNGYPKDATSGTSYCIELSKLVDTGLLESPLTDPVTGSGIALNNYVKVQVARGVNDAFGEIIKVSDSVIVGTSCEGQTYNRMLENYAYDSNTKYYSYPVTQNGYYKIELWGAQGGGITGGHGAYTSGVVNLNKDETIYIFIGSQGGELDQVTNAGGYNGGGFSGNNSGGHSYGGGGATDIRYFASTPTAEDLEWNSELGLKSRIMVAAGGGGSVDISGNDGGFAGGLTGGRGKGTWSSNWTYNGINYKNTTPTVSGATQISGGINNYQDNTRDGSFGYGITSNSAGWGGGGGAGYYAGATGHGTGGSGGSSYISGFTGCVAITSSESVAPRLGTNNAECTTGTSDNLCSKHYSNKIFIGNSNDLKMLSGENELYSPTGSIEIGHSGNGHARITYIGGYYAG